MNENEPKAPALNAVDEKIIAACAESVKPRRALEIAVVRRLLAALIGAGYYVKADNGEDPEFVGNIDEMVEVLFACDSANIFVARDGKKSFIFLVMGNDGYDVVNDYGVSLEEIVNPVIRWAEAEYERANV